MAKAEADAQQVVQEEVPLSSNEYSWGQLGSDIVEDTASKLQEDVVEPVVKEAKNLVENSPVQSFLSNLGTLSKLNLFEAGDERRSDNPTIASLINSNVIPDIEITQTAVASDALGDKKTQAMMENVVSIIGAGNIRYFNTTKSFEGKHVRYPRKEVYANGSPVSEKGKPVFHIGFGLKMPLTEEDLAGLPNIGGKNKALLMKSPSEYKKGEKPELSEEQAQVISARRFKVHSSYIQKNHPWVKKLPAEIQEVVYDLGYNVGMFYLDEGKWDKFRTRIKDGKYKSAANLLNKRYLRQTGRRAESHIKTLSNYK
jgi:hypothetical protein